MMYILSQDKKFVVNTNTMKTMYAGYGDVTSKEVCYEAVGTDSWQTLGEYRGKERASEVLQDIFGALSQGKVTFEMPEA